MIGNGIKLLIVLVVIAQGAAACRAAESTAERRKRVKQMSAAEQQVLRQEQARFEQLNEAEQSRLRDLSSQLATADDGDRLRQTMLRYSAWLRTLNASQRTALLSLPADNRVSEIKALLEQQDRQRFQAMFDYKLQPDDRKALTVWMSRLIARNEAQLLQKLSPLQRERLDQVEDKARRYAMLAAMYRFRVGENARLFEVLKPTAKEFEQLAASLAPPARAMLAEPRSAEQRERLLQSWVRAAIDSRVRPELSRDELMRFFNEHLTAEQRNRLESLPRERMRFELQRLYWQHRIQVDLPRDQNRPPNAKRDTLDQ